MYSHLIPLYDNVLIRRIELEEEKSVGGIFIPDGEKQNFQMGEVVAVGSGVIGNHGGLIPLFVKTGDKVLLGRYGGTELDKELLVIKEQQILGII